MIYLIMELLNHRVLYDDDAIAITNFLKQTTEIDFTHLDSISYSFLGYGKDLVFKDLDGKSIKVDSNLRGFQSLVAFLEAKKLI